ncbi:ABC transporter substrate-binding protein [Serinicoccus chungangensis]|uniref:ABC transporter substrate-binding protein n=1 Tax=Serinicoccus chungangensis TaxID=767452 RepID=A0A0W8I196_9MICO|nr:metal ABC transporter substrate-binding protein [Serinicoccus chungangensis]KUG51497.1 ABC transporter substrate-binding protein [Serinicoccus chungangensis]
MPRLRTPVILASCLALVLGACGTTSEGSGTADGSGEEASLEVVASFYPLEYLVERIAGERAEISVLTGPGADPHDAELSPRAVETVGRADLVVYSSGLQAPVDDAVAGQAPDTSLDVTPVADLMVAGESAEEHAEHDHAEEGDGHDHGGEDPHFWLDTQRYADVAEAVADRLAQVDPEGADTYQANVADLVSDLEALDEEYAAALADCESRDLVTSHEAFGYLAARYDLHQYGITGISPESEPSPARLAEVSAQVEELGVDTVFAEPLVGDQIASTVAQETGVEVLTLDPIESLTEATADSDYRQIMRANLEAMSEGLGCS